MRNTEIHQITLRLPEHLYATVKRVARQRRTSVNRLAQEGLRRLAEEEMARKMRDAYDVLGRTKTETDVDAHVKAQAEVVNRE